MPVFDDGYDSAERCPKCGLWFNRGVDSSGCPHRNLRQLRQRAHAALFTALIEAQVCEILEQCHVSTKPGEL